MTHLPPNPIAVRVGCALAYDVVRPTPVLLLIQPRTVPGQVLAKESLSCPGPVEQWTDHHGNLVLRTLLQPGRNDFRHDAILFVRGDADDAPAASSGPAPGRQPWDVLRYTYPSRYCESDRLASFARQRFGGIAPGAALAEAICDWTHRHIEYRYGSGSPHLSAADVIERRHGVCRDFAHVMIALCRALDLPARYAAGHLPYRGVAEHDIGIDFHAWCEVHVGGRWRVYDPRHGRVHPGRVKIAHGMDAVDAAIATLYGQASTAAFQVWAYQIDAERVRVGDPVAIVRGASGMAEAAAANDAAVPAAAMLKAASTASSPAPLHG